MGRTGRETRALRLARALLALLALALLASCGGGEADDGPPGAWWAGRGPAVRQILEQLARLEGTPLARRARQLAVELPECDSVGLHAPDGSAAQLVGSARCLDAGDPLEQARRRADRDLVFALPSAGGGALRGTLHVEETALQIDLRWQGPPADGALRLLVPGEAPAGPDRLASAGRLLHLRVRPRNGLDLAALIPAGSQADRLFRLRSGIFASTVLDGTWEGSVYLPERAGGMPGVVLALGFSLRSAAVTAAERFVADLQETWPVRRSELRLAAGDGACLPDLNVLPDLAPCYVATTDALVVGWNPASLERALTGAVTAAPDAAGRLDVDFALIQRADDLLARHFAGSERPLSWPWSRLTASGGADGDDLVLRFTLVAAPRSAS